MTLPSSGPLYMSQIAAEMAIVGAVAMTRQDLRYMANVPSGAYNLQSFYGKTCETYDLTVGNASGPGYVLSNWGAISPTTLRGLTISQIYVNDPPNLKFTTAVTSISPPFGINTFRYMFLREGSVTTNPPDLIFAATNAAYSNGFWTWTGSIPVSWSGMVGNHTRVQFVY